MSRSTERYYFYKSHGICVDCGREKAQKRYVRCLECRFKARETNLKTHDKYRAKRNVQHSEHMKQLKAERKAKGLCTLCGKPATGGFVNCKSCRAKRNQYAKKWYHAHGTTPEWLLGDGLHCAQCGKDVEKKGDKLCRACYERNTAIALNIPRDRSNHLWRKDMIKFFCKIRGE